MVFIILMEYLQLFLWLQANTEVGRFIAAMVMIISKDVKAFMVILVVIIMAFSACFIILLSESKFNFQGSWISLSWMIFELTLGTGEFFTDELSDVLVDSFDGWRRTLITIIFALYIWLMLVVMMNLLIAVMSKTTHTISTEMPFREKRLKLSSVSLIARRLRLWQFLLCCCRKTAKTSELRKCFCKMTAGGEQGEEVGLPDLQKVNGDLQEYYNGIYYLCTLEKEIEVEKSKEDKMYEILLLMKKKYISEIQSEKNVNATLL